MTALWTEPGTPPNTFCLQMFFEGFLCNFPQTSGSCRNESHLFLIKKSSELTIIVGAEIRAAQEQTKLSKTAPAPGGLSSNQPTPLSVQWRLYSTHRHTDTHTHAHVATAPVLSGDIFKVRAQRWNERRADPYRGGSVIRTLYWRLSIGWVTAGFHHSERRVFKNNVLRLFIYVNAHSLWEYHCGWLFRSLKSLTLSFIIFKNGKSVRNFPQKCLKMTLRPLRSHPRGQPQPGGPVRLPCLVWSTVSSGASYPASLRS